MREKLELIKSSPIRVLDAGCGEGADLAQLQAHFPKSHVLGVDVSFAMLASGIQLQRELKSSIGRFVSTIGVVGPRTVVNQSHNSVAFETVADRQTS